MLHATGSVVLIKSDGRSSDVHVFKSELSLVLYLLNNGSLAEGSNTHGSPQHETALEVVIERSKEVLSKLVQGRADEQRLEDGTDAVCDGCQYQFPKEEMVGDYCRRCSEEDE